MDSQSQASSTTGVSSSSAMNNHSADAGDNSNNSSSNNDSNNNNNNNNNSTIILPPNFIDDPATFLTSIASQSPSSQGISLLAGPVSRWFMTAASSSNQMGQPGQHHHPAKHVAHIYLGAAATQLRMSKNQVNVQPLAGVTAAASVGSRSALATARDAEQEKIQNRYRNETLAAVEAAAMLCSDNREAIVNSGILPVLAQIVTDSSNNNNSNDSSNNNNINNNETSIATSLSSLSASSSKAYPPLHPAHTVFLQCIIVAEQYQYVEGIRGSWPRPSSALKDVSIVLRYYYLRGIVHFSCRDYAMAHRCWWTCLSVPADDGCSVIAISAWKKVTLVQPLLNNNTGSTASGKVHPATRLPKCMPKLPTKLSDLHSSSKFRLARSLAAESKEEEKKDNMLVYTKLGPAVEAGDRQAVETLVRTHESILQADGNLELVRQCIRRVREVQVQTAAKRFSVTSVAILARRWNATPEEVTQQLLDAIGIVPCQIEEDGTVVFSDNEDISCNTGSTQSLDLTQWMKLLERMQQLDVDISTNSKYKTLIRKEEKGGGNSSGSGTMISDIFAAAGAGPQGVEDF
ncbi:hypothetical protein FRACYDRAFT_260885 [Fragilariopsis cylindrus CCMP1102]|uniref:COP9 signalosome complex subunit 3 n=1 Tax=Fragilariopsis cylindrus CCMP1102 TaxID=635003 RepID=A0A1E7FHG0_9STRA|nr:hypothetical protein FRACYDRAFT_260885 [Fragilariopsis cylindrus CCMP1102]|eukprot:OEU17475.1 hypothetical protein FRACYDRAFT_260885 [Fragilariopsis cylindrus CCMP1102]